MTGARFDGAGGTWISLLLVQEGDRATKKSLFIQVAWYPINELRDHLEHVRLYHKDPTKDDYIYDVVLDEIGSESALSGYRLDIIVPYLPGGDKQAFNNVFVGSHFVNWGGPGHAYYHGMLDPDHRWRNLRIQRELWDAFASRYRHVYHHHYINHEGVLDFLDIEPVRQAYEAYLIQSVRDSHHAAPNRAILWSPAIWSSRPLTSAEESAVTKTFQNVQREALHIGHTRGGVTWLHLQDMMGRGWVGVDLTDVKTWISELRAAYPWASLGVNLEMFRFEDGRVVSADPDVVQEREDWYEAQDIPVFSSWEMRYWMDTHTEL